MRDLRFGLGDAITTIRVGYRVVESLSKAPSDASHILDLQGLSHNLEAVGASLWIEEPHEAPPDDVVQSHERLGGMLKHYHRIAA